MTTTPTISYRDQRTLLRARMLLQRSVIHERLNPTPASTSEFPRSRTMRLLVQHPQIGSGLALAAAALLVRPQWIRQGSLLLGAVRVARQLVVAAR